MIVQRLKDQMLQKPYYSTTMTFFQFRRHAYFPKNITDKQLPTPWSTLVEGGKVPYRPTW